MATQASWSGFPSQDTWSGDRKTGITLPGSPRAPAQHCWIGTTQHISHPCWTLAHRQGWEHKPEPAGASLWQHWIKQSTEALQQLQTPKETLLPDVTFSAPLFQSQKKPHWKPAKILISNTPRGSEFSPWKRCSAAFLLPWCRCKGITKLKLVFL